MVAVVVPDEMREPRDGLDGRDAVQVQCAFGFGERAERVLEDRGEKLLLATEVVIEHAFICLRTAGNLVDACAEQPTICKFLGRR